MCFIYFPNSGKRTLTNNMLHIMIVVWAFHIVVVDVAAVRFNACLDLIVLVMFMMMQGRLQQLQAVQCIVIVQIMQFEVVEGLLLIAHILHRLAAVRCQRTVGYLLLHVAMADLVDVVVSDNIQYEPTPCYRTHCHASDDGLSLSSLVEPRWPDDAVPVWPQPHGVRIGA